MVNFLVAVDLYVDLIYDVKWNKQAFQDLVVDEDIKELVQAVVMKQLVTQKSTDVISGKGNGLIILLHGGPGTGKTFTAEGVAEFAEKPLFRVTCGDIGTDSQVVERRLQAALNLGKIWDCGEFQCCAVRTR
jgi:ATP-dependent Lon protease